jgi:hypoxanthine phosphoribosyltransferase
MLRPLIRADRLRARVRQLGRRLASDLAGYHPERPPVLLALLDGSFCFVADLARCVPLPDLRLTFLRASSYGDATTSRGTVSLGALPECRERTVVVVDDILDTGRTLHTVCAALREAGAAAVRTCVLLDKPARREVFDASGPVRADYVGFTIPDAFVVGYGLDFAGRYRHLPDICVVE